MSAQAGSRSSLGSGPVKARSVQRTGCSHANGTPALAGSLSVIRGAVSRSSHATKESETGPISGGGVRDCAVAEEVDPDRDAADSGRLSAHEDASRAGLASDHEVVARMLQAPAELSISPRVAAELDVVRRPSVLPNPALPV